MVAKEEREDSSLARSVGALKVDLVARVDRPGDVVKDLGTMRLK